nr:DoxX family protein [uncultured Roseateles sp.]
MPPALRDALLSPWVQGLGLLLLCSPYLQGAFCKLRDFRAAVAEMQHFGLTPAAPLAAFTIAFELVASGMVLLGLYRWLGALALAGFTLLASGLADDFWRRPKPERVQVANSFFEHWGLAGGFLLVAWHDLGVTHVF